MPDGAARELPTEEAAAEIPAEEKGRDHQGGQAPRIESEHVSISLTGLVGRSCCLARVLVREKEHSSDTSGNQEADDRISGSRDLMFWSGSGREPWGRAQRQKLQRL